MLVATSVPAVPLRLATIPVGLLGSGGRRPVRRDLREYLRVPERHSGPPQRTGTATTPVAFNRSPLVTCQRIATIVSNAAAEGSGLGEGRDCHHAPDSSAT